MSAVAVEFDVRSLPERLHADPARLELARRRQAAVWARRRPDKWPILFHHGGLMPDQQEIPKANYEEAFYDADRMLCDQVRGACGVLNARSDAVPSIRANLGVGVLLACVGLEQEVYPDKMPWPREHLAREQVAGLQPEDIRVQGSFERALEYMRRYREVLGDAIPLYCADTQGPFDLAHLLMGDELFLALYDDPPLVHHLMEFSLRLIVTATRLMKEPAAEPADRLHHSNKLYAENMGVRICEDTTVLISPEAMREFAMPYTQRLAREFGGAWVHYCGRNDHLTAAVCELPEVRGINFGHIPGHEHDHPFEQDMELIRSKGKVYVGGWPRRSGESGAAYLARLYGWAAQGVLIPEGNAAVGRDGDFGSVREALDYWYGLQA